MFEETWAFRQASAVAANYQSELYIKTKYSLFV